MSKVKYLEPKVGDTILYLGWGKKYGHRKIVEYEGVVTKVDIGGYFVVSGNYKTYLYKHQVLKIKENFCEA